ncbi:hypothetical protein T01_5206 [Trichinella spiralis]|uniref:Uncharacterized protein n=1 Tax=Trichinella spiralis TaxID=6334 RepID=A0A0V1BBG7_TRISP|nr:hypothetical protein T01_5206 [Trichinella spiralis]
MHCKQVDREKLPFSKLGRSPENYFIYICRKSCKHDGPNFRITLYTVCMLPKLLLSSFTLKCTLPSIKMLAIHPCCLKMCEGHSRQSSY